MALWPETKIARLHQLVSDIQSACDTPYINYLDRLQELTDYCLTENVIAGILAELPEERWDFQQDWREVHSQWSGGIASYGLMWNAVLQIVEGGQSRIDDTWMQIHAKNPLVGFTRITNIFVLPLVHYLLSRLEASGSMIHLLLRYKRWVEWFEADRLRTAYENGEQRQREAILDTDIRRFLLMNGIDYPFSQPRSPGGQADVVAQLDSDDPLVMEVKIWDSTLGYRTNRVRDGLRQVIDYATKYGKHVGYVVVFNLDEQPLSFVNPSVPVADQWPSRMIVSGRTYFFIDVHIAERTQPISQLDKGKKVQTHRINLQELVNEVANENIFSQT